MMYCTIINLIILKYVLFFIRNPQVVNGTFNTKVFEKVLNEL